MKNLLKALLFCILTTNSFGEVLFQLVEGSFTWDEAKADAELRGGRLAIIDTPEKNSEVMSLDGNWGQFSAAFIGLTDRDTEGEWKWIDGSPLTWSNWKGGEPNDAGGEDIAAIVKNEGWNDEWVERNGEFNRQPYILELTTETEPTLDDGLVAYYPFNGNANDETGNGLNFKTTPKLSTDRNGESESTSYLDSSETFSTSDLSLSGSNFSGSVWVYLEKTPSSQGERALVHGSWDNSTGLFSLAFWGDGRGGISTRDSQIQREVIAPSGTFSQKQWYHLSFTSDGENLSFYIDGELFSSIKSNLKTTKSAPLSIGGDIANSYYFDSGKIDDVRIYNRALSSSEVSELYELEKPSTDDSIFSVVEGNFTWDEAKADAEAKGGRLAVLNTQDKINQVNDFLNSIKPVPEVYIGLTDRVEEGNWVWINGKPLTASSWRGGEPNGGTSENVAHLFSSDLAWNDTNGNRDKKSYLLEKNVSLNDGLVAYYPFNGNANDESENNNNGAVNGVTLSADRNGEASSAYEFDGSSYIELPDGIYFDGPFTISGWVKISEHCNWCRLVDFSSENQQNHVTFSLSQNRSGQPRGDVSGNNNSILSDTSIPLNKWSQILWKYDGEFTEMFINGNRVAVEEWSNPPLAVNRTDNWIGRSNWENSPTKDERTRGLIDDIRIYDRALSASEVSKLYELEKPSLEDGLVAYYPFNGNANDESANDNDGTVNGATLTTDRFGQADQAYSFDQGSGYIQSNLPSNLNESEPFTTSFWVKTRSDQNDMWLLSMGSFQTDNGFHISINDAFSESAPNSGLGYGYWSWFGTGNGIEPNYSFPVGIWKQITIVRRSQAIKFFIDGKQLGNDLELSAGAVIDSKGLLVIGAIEPDKRKNFDGIIDDIRIYDRALSSSEVSELYELEKPTLPDPSPPVVSFDEFYEALPDETITIDATPESGFPDDFTYQWYFGNFLIPEILGGKSNSFVISANDDNNGVWTVKISNSAGSTESSFYFAAYKDTDGDGISDGREEYVIGSDPTLADTDGDGLKDYDEVYTYGTSFSKPDTDGDGFDDIFEINTKYDPLNKESTPEAYLEIQTAVEIKFNAGKNMTYKIENSVDLENWSAIETGVAGEGKLVKRLYSIDDYKGRYFRVRREEK